VTLLNLEVFLALVGVYFAVIAGQIALNPSHPRRVGSAIFWALLAVVFVAGKHLPPVVVGYGVAILALLAGARQVAPPQREPAEAVDRQAEAARLGDRLLVPAVLIPVLAIAGGFTLGNVRWGAVELTDPRQATQVALGLAAIAGLIVALRITRARPGVALSEGGRLLQALGWALILPQMLASLGGVFARAGVGDVIAKLVGDALPAQHPLAAVIAYCAGMALFTIIMGNAFAAFPVITIGIGLPFIVKQHGGDPAIMGALGMLSGYCGTLVTPMAANFNLVPAILLELEDKNAVIKAQAPMAAAIWVFNVVAMYLCVYRF
jgi:uncharacterized membrane protein